MENYLEVLSNLIEWNLGATLFGVALLLLVVYPIIFIRSEYLQDIKFFSVIYRKMMLTGKYKEKLNKHYKEEFIFKHDLLESEFINHSSYSNFETMYEKPTFTRYISYTGEENEDISFDSVIKTLERGAKLLQLVIIEGKAGYGKTNFLKYIGYLAIKKELIIKSALYIQVEDIERYFKADDSDLTRNERFLKLSGATLCSMLSFCYRKMGINISLCEIEKITNERSALLLDGFDETKNNAFSEELIDKIRVFRSEKPNLTIVISGRPGSFSVHKNYMPYDDYYFKINSFGVEEIRSLVKNIFFKLYGEDEYLGEYFEFCKRIIGNRAILNMAKVPFLLTLMIRLKNNDKDLPEHRDELIREFVNIAIDRKLVEHGNGMNDALLRTLCKMSYDILSSKIDKHEINIFIEGEISTISTSMFKNSKDVIGYLRKSGLLIHGSNDFEFVHKSIEDYLCARYLYLAVYRAPEEIVKYDLIFNKNNIDIVFFYCCMLKDASLLFSCFIERERYDTCLELIVWSDLGSNLKIKSKYVDRFWDVLKSKKDDSFVVWAGLYLSLARLKCGGSYSSKPISIKEYEYVVGDLPKRNDRFGDVVGLNENMVEDFYCKLNKKFNGQINTIDEAGGSGEFKAVSIINRFKEDIGNDTVMIDEKSDYSIALPDATRFKEIKNKLRGEIQAHIEITVSNICNVFRVNNVSGLRERLCQDVFDGFSIDILLKVNLELNNICTSDQYTELRNYLFGEDVSVRDELIKTGKINYKLISGVLLDGNEKDIFDYFSQNISRGVDCEENQVEIALNAAMFQMIASVLMEYTPKKYNYSKLIYLKILLNYMADNKYLDLWGRLKVQYSINDNLSHYIN